MNIVSPSKPIHSCETLAAVCTTPLITTPGKVMPTGPSVSKWATTCWTTSATSWGLAPLGVGMR